ncbi:membrane protein involved in the export of O-antigen and teichoic acid [Rivularia sp. PCC 7116]|uniref:oligosaccharide flippase family protein n=1 Tax=Rivularia sp. PCC 7116 TaxID=373994 RepID=UPI00029F2AA5|nr:oligosaccharide flippase family protein [Rivularia sp. PCC 7116]AFY54697.1 membrane protein involved in the export of O-antigen and teichoic acid [Rivularia sp. PCC 7116]
MQESKPLSLRRNFSWTFIGNAVYAASQWGMLVVFAKLGSPEMVGQFTLGLAITAPIVLLTNLQLRGVQVTDTKQEYLFSDYFGLRIISTGLALLLIAIITYLAGYSRETSLVILVIGLAKAVESISDVFHGLIQQQERMDRIAISLMIKGPLSLLFLCIGVYLSKSVFWGGLGLVFAWTIVLIAYDIRSVNFILRRFHKENIKGLTIKPRWHLETLRKLVWLCLPLGFVMMLISLNTNIPRYFIEQYLGERELGIYAALAYLIVAGNMVVKSLGQSASPKLAKYYATGNSKGFRRLLLQLVGIAIILGSAGFIAAVFAGKQILTLLYQYQYAQYTNLFVLLMVAGGMNYISSFLGYGITSARYFRIQMPLFLAVTTTSAIACLWLLPKFGLLGAAFALVISSFVQIACSLGVIVHALSKLNNYSK